MRDGRKILGILRSFDQFANLVLEAARERIIVGQQFGEVPLGLHVVRGENVVLVGEVDAARDPPPGLELVRLPAACMPGLRALVLCGSTSTAAWFMAVACL